MRTLSSLVVGLLITACVRTNATLLSPSAVVRPKVASDSVRIYRTVDQVRGKYEEIALLRSDGPDGSKDSKMLASMRKKAGELGANGLILVAIDDPGLVSRMGAVVLGTGAEKKARAVAIFVFPDSTAR